ncbi:hypothetical protein HDU87_004480 [Geranomyces variabilis]|uniref:Uncharacterized protein n=1 Tax=Geranomyces variabilis TaxID=109894 RepID=A0AAD5XPY4_9FUNG|nr:hypothetical protein HDU87_004480 [Geranomyces variabilis]
MPTAPAAVASSRRSHNGPGASSPRATADTAPAAAASSSSSSSSSPTDNTTSTTTIPSRSKRIPNVKQQKYIDDFKHDLNHFAKYPPSLWDRLKVTAGQNDGTWKSICRHFIRKPGTDDREILFKTWVRLNPDLLKHYDITEVAFLNYTSRDYNGSRHPWRFGVSEDMGHIVSKTDRYSHEIYIKLEINLRNRTPSRAKRNIVKRR